MVTPYRSTNVQGLLPAKNIGSHECFFHKS